LKEEIRAEFQDLCAMKKHLRLGLLAIVPVLVIGLAAPNRADNRSGAPTVSRSRISFNRDIRPIMTRHCFKCHGPDLKKAGLDLQDRTAAVKELKSGNIAIVPGKSADSELFTRVSSEYEEERMPPKAAGPRLTAAEVAKLRAWIDQGAKYETHWAYVKPIRPALPAVTNRAWVRNAVDYFVLARLEKEGLTPSPEADRETLIRRLSLDLTGLPPTVVEVDAFLADPSPAAYEKVVDRLLASPHYGEHQARPWLDQARYADTNGYEKDDRRTICPYRDWVIKAFNQDMPFDQFTIEQIAGDLLPNATPQQQIATGFHRNTMVNTEGGTDDEEFRVAGVVDRVNTTKEVWMGTTFGCCQCHNHKYDPFTQKEFYRLFAFFNNTADRGRSNDPMIPVPSDEQPRKRAQIAAEIARLQRQLDADTPELAAAQARWEKGLAGRLPTWTPLDAAVLTSSQGTTLAKQKDGSILATGTSPDKDTYTIVVYTNLTGITGFRLAVLPDRTLPNKGPGRAGGNFVLNELRVTAAVKDGSPQVVVLRSATADFSQNGFAVAGAIDGNVQTGWAVAPQFGRAHEAVFETKEDAGFKGGTMLTFTLEQTFGGRHTIGRFRLDASTSPRPVRVSPLPDDIIKILAVEPAKRTGPQKAALTRFYRSIAPELAGVRQQLAALRKQEAAVQPPTTLVMKELPSPRSTFVHIRGNHKNHGAKVSPGVPAKLHALARGHPANRLALARWLVDPNNPLVGRVTMNRIWARYFGRGFVETSEDFGAQGDPPSHPELLDSLATELVRQNWSLKAMHKAIVMSAAYRQTSRVTPKLHQRDPFNRLLARGPRFRLDAEMVRDNALAISGLLSRKIGGPSVFPYQPDGIWFNPYSGDRWVMSSGGDQYRRGLYTFWRRTAPFAAFMAFDAPSREVCTERRPRTNTPLQALATLNDKAFVDPAAALARRMMAEVRGADKDRAVYGFRLAVARRPGARELDLLLKLYQANLAKYRKDPADAKALAASGLGAPPPELDVAQLAAWTVVANVLLNLDETITKG
jgi:hypothetical protein